MIASSGLRSFGLLTDPDFPGAFLGAIGYSTAKAALNMMTLNFADELKDTRIKVNAVNTGDKPVLTKLARQFLGEAGVAEVGPEGFTDVGRVGEFFAAVATLPEDGPTGAFLGPDFERVPW